MLTVHTAQYQWCCTMNVGSDDVVQLKTCTIILTFTKLLSVYYEGAGVLSYETNSWYEKNFLCTCKYY